MKNNSYKGFFSNFTSKTKLDIILSLVENPLTVTEITSRVEKEQSNISHHLTNLTKCNILSSQKKGKYRIYSLNKSTILPLLKIAELHTTKKCSSNCNKICILNP